MHPTPSPRQRLSPRPARLRLALLRLAQRSPIRGAMLLAIALATGAVVATPNPAWAQAAAPAKAAKPAKPAKAPKAAKAAPTTPAPTAPAPTAPAPTAPAPTAPAPTAPAPTAPAPTAAEAPKSPEPAKPAAPVLPTPAAPAAPAPAAPAPAAPASSPAPAAAVEVAKPADVAKPGDEATAAAAEKVADEGRDAYRGGRYADAIGLFEKAFAIQAKPAYLYNMARAKEKLADYDNATKYLEKYIETYKAQNAGADPQNAADVKNLIRDFKQRAFEALPEVTINSVPPGAQVYVAAPVDGLLVEGAVPDKGQLIGSTPVTTHMKPGVYPMTVQLINHVEHKAELQVPQSGKVNLSIAMKIKQARSGLALWCNVKGAQVAVDGKIVAVTPYAGTLPMQPGVHQVTITRVGYNTVDKQVTLSEDKLTTVRMSMTASSGPPASWRSFLGWPLLIIGGAGIGGGVLMKTLANREYTGTPKFLQWQKYQNYGYWGGGATVGVALGLIIWDWTRSGMNSDDLVGGENFGDGVVDAPLPPPEATP